MKVAQRLSVPLTQKQIEAAERLHEMMPQWRADDEALTLVAERFPGFDHPACLVKIVSLNGLYGTNLYALHRMANHVVAVLAKKDVRTTSVSHRQSGVSFVRNRLQVVGGELFVRPTTGRL